MIFQQGQKRASSLLPAMLNATSYAGPLVSPLVLLALSLIILLNLGIALYTLMFISRMHFELIDKADIPPAPFEATEDRVALNDLVIDTGDDDEEHEPTPSSPTTPTSPTSNPTTTTTTTTNVFSDSSTIILDIGGTLFTTTVATITAGEDSYFSRRMHFEDIQATAGPSMFVDRDPKHFRHILNFLRDSRPPQVDSTATQFATELLYEADFYNLTGLAESLSEQVRKLKVLHEKARTNARHVMLSSSLPPFTLCSHVCSLCFRACSRQLASARASHSSSLHPSEKEYKMVWAKPTEIEATFKKFTELGFSLSFIVPPSVAAAAAMSSPSRRRDSEPPLPDPPVLMHFAKSLTQSDVKFFDRLINGT